MRIFLAAILIATILPGIGKSQNMDRSEIRATTDKYFLESVGALREFLAIPNSSRNKNDIARNVDWCVDRFKALGFDTKVIHSDGVPHVFAESKRQSKHVKTILFYMQIDGQPVDSAKWQQESPYIPVLKECQDGSCTLMDWSDLAEWQPGWRIFARSASDSKGPAAAFMEALRIMQEGKHRIPYNVKVIMDFQEELGSPALPQLVRDNQELFKADIMLIMDGTRHISNLPTLTFGARGIATLTMTVYGASKDLHSGQYGNFAPNPVFDLARLLAAMKDKDGRVLIPGYYDGVNLSDEYKATINDIPEDNADLMQTLGLARTEKIGETYQEALQYPSFNVRGLQAGWVGDQVRTIIPASATAEIDMRLVTETPAERQIDLVKNFIISRGYHILDSLPNWQERLDYPYLLQFSYRIGSRPFKTDMNSPLGTTLRQAMERTFGTGNYVSMQATGGSQPIAPFITTLGIPAVSIRIPNPDNSIHAPNENLRLGNYHEGIMMCLGILSQKF